MSEQRVLWDRVAMGVLIIAPLVALVWWLESRFGALIAVMSLGLLAGAAFFMLGALFNQSQSKLTMENVADFIDSMAQTEKARQGVAREYAKAEGHILKKRADLEVLDARRVDQIAQSRAKMIAAQNSQDAQESEFEDFEIEYFEVD